MKRVSFIISLAMNSRRIARRLLFVAAVILLAATIFGWWHKGGSSTRDRAAGSRGVVTGNAVAGQKTAADKSSEPDPSPTPDSSRPTDQPSGAPTAGQPASPDPVSTPALPPAADGLPKPSTRALAAGGKSVPSILQGADMSDPEVRARKVAELHQLEENQKNAVIEKARELGIPLRKEGPGHKVSTLYDIRGDEPLYRSTLNANAAISTGATLLAPAPYSLDGTGVKVGVWDGGLARNTHVEFATNRVTLKNPNSPYRFDDHATHVTGTIGATGILPAAKGMAPKVNIDSYDWDFDYAEMGAAGAASAGASNFLPLSNHSYGYGAGTSDMGRYETEAAAVDAVAAGLPYFLPFWAAGNEQDVLTSLGGYQSITFNALAKNLMTIGATDDAVTSGVRDPSKAIIASFSSLGPCDDGRIKPDIVANGVNLKSTISTTDTAYNDTVNDPYSGTSMATPNAMGSAVLLEQLYAREFSGQWMRASLLKALIIHTADDRGNAGPDYKYGWGLMNVKAAADLILAHKASLSAPKLIEGTVTNAANLKTHTFVWDGVSPIRATLCWTDPAGTAQTASNSRTPNLKHNLDAKITAPNGSTIYSPYIMPFVGTWTQASMSLNATTGKNNVDNVEQVYLAAPSQAGTYTVTVSVDGTISTPDQAYSLVITGGKTNPPPTVTLTSPSDGSVSVVGEPVTVAANATDLTASGTAGTVTQVEFFAGATSIGVDNTAPYSISWTPAVAGSYAITAKATDSESATATSTPATIVVLSGDGTPSITSFTATSGIVGSQVVLTGTNFAGITSVKFNGINAVFTVNSSTQITATVPNLATTGTLTVSNSYGTGTSLTSFTVTPFPVLISQIYGAGGSSGATKRNDYVELYNRSGGAVSLTGWSIQYATATSWTAFNLSGTIAAGHYYLLGLGSSGSTGTTLPTADATGSTNISATAGKIALRNTTTAFTTSSPAGLTGLQDFVGYGSAAAWDGTAAAPTTAATTAIFRAGAGATDTNQNGADFSTATPSPRNTASTVTPVITSASTANGTVGTAFTYQITAANTSTSFYATGLPSGLSINTSTGAITGTPTTAGLSTATITATNATGSGSASLTLTINSAGGGSIHTFSENMGTASSITAIASNVFQNTGLTFMGTADVRNTNPSSGYTGASGGANVFIASTAGLYFDISGINTTGYTNLSLSLGHFKSTTASNNELVIETSSDGITYTPMTYSRPTGAGTATWLAITPTGSIPAVANLHIRFRQTINGGPQFCIDDVVLSGTAPIPMFAAWIGGYAVGALTGVNDDFDHDGLPNAIEDILGTPPNAYSAGLVNLSKTASTLVFRHTRSNTISPDLTASYEWSANLVNWNAAGTSLGGVTVNIVAVVINDVAAPANDLVEVTATVTGSPAKEIFVRLKAVK